MHAADPADTRPMCRACMVPCVVCRVDPGWVLDGCPHRHTLCEECAVEYLTQAPRPPWRCPCGEGVALTSDDLPSPVAWRVAQRLAAQTTEEEEEERREEDPVLALCHRAATLHCPWCAAPFYDFDGCAALRCPHCDGYFCGLCLRKCVNTVDAHSHAASCATNPTPGNYFVPSELLVSVHAATRRAQLLAYANEAACRHGAALGLALLHAAARLNGDRWLAVEFVARRMAKYFLRRT